MYSVVTLGSWTSFRQKQILQQVHTNGTGKSKTFTAILRFHTPAKWREVFAKWCIYLTNPTISQVIGAEMELNINFFSLSFTLTVILQSSEMMWKPMPAANDLIKERETPISTHAERENSHFRLHFLLSG